LGNRRIEVESASYEGDFYYFVVCSHECATECGGE